MKILYLVLSISVSLSAFTQEELPDSILAPQRKTEPFCNYKERMVKQRALKGATYNPLLLINNVIAGFDEIGKINTANIDTILVLTCPRSDTFGDIGINGIISVHMKKRKSFSRKKQIQNLVVMKKKYRHHLQYYLNGYLLDDPSRLIFTSSIKHIEVYEDLKIAIWTISEEEQKRTLSPLCYMGVL